MRYVTNRTFLEVLTIIWMNITSGWFAILIVSPGILGTKSFIEYI